MASKPVSDAFAARLALWANREACPLVEENAVATAELPYMEIQFPVATEERMTVGTTAVYRERGGARFIISIGAFAPGWKDQVLTWIEELRDLFRGQSFGGVVTQEASPAVIDERNADGTTYRVPFVVLYTFDAIKQAST